MINIERKENIDVVTFAVSNINALIADEICDDISKIIVDPNSKVIIDLTGVEYIDSSGFGCFLTVMRTARSNYGILKFANPQPEIMELFQTLHLNTVFQIYDDIDNCILSFR
jgi:anti-anti-sigma factor